MKIFAISSRSDNATQSEIDRLKTSEAYRAWCLFRDDLIREMYWRTDDETGVVLVLECPSIAEAERVVSYLPMVIADQIRFELIPVGPCDHFVRLFAEEFQAVQGAVESEA